MTVTLVVQAGGQRQDAILVSLAVADEELVLRAVDVANGQREAFTQAQAAGVDEFDGGPITTQADVREQVVHLAPGEHLQGTSWSLVRT